jgi:hypothetical protein
MIRNLPQVDSNFAAMAAPPQPEKATLTSFFPKTAMQDLFGQVSGGGSLEPEVDRWFHQYASEFVMALVQISCQAARRRPGRPDQKTIRQEDIDYVLSLGIFGWPEQPMPQPEPAPAYTERMERYREWRQSRGQSQ